MHINGKDQRRAVGGLARALALTPERRTEIARQAAAKRWASPVSSAEGDRLPTKAYTRKLKGVPLVKKISVASDYHIKGEDFKTSVLLEKGTVLRTFTGATGSVDERVQSYLLALQDLGLELVVTYSTTKSVGSAFVDD